MLEILTRCLAKDLAIKINEFGSSGWSVSGKYAGQERAKSTCA